MREKGFRGSWRFLRLWQGFSAMGLGLQAFGLHWCPGLGLRLNSGFAGFTFYTISMNDVMNPSPPPLPSPNPKPNKTKPSRIEVEPVKHRRKAT